MLALQMQMFATEHLKNSRPKSKFGGAKRIDFAKQKKLFTTAVESPGVTIQAKLLEFQHYFEGAALQMIEADLANADQEVGFALAMSRLEKKFGKRRETALEQLEELLQGKPLPEKDANALLEFWGKLAGIYATAKDTNRAGEFETKTTMDTIVRRKTPHLSVKWAEKCVKCRMNNDRELNFTEFLEFINERHDFLDHLNRITATTGGHTVQRSGGGGSSAKVAATSTAPAAATKAAAKAAPKSTGCVVCGAGHSIAVCEQFRELEIGAKKTAVYNAGACFKCLERGHLARDCKFEGRCVTCQRAHHDAAHTLQRDDTTDTKTAA